MYFGNYELQKSLLEKCLKSHVSNHRSTVNMLKRIPNTTEICTVAFLSYFFITLRKLEMEYVSLSDI